VCQQINEHLVYVVHVLVVSVLFCKQTDTHRQKLGKSKKVQTNYAGTQKEKANKRQKKA